MSAARAILVIEDDQDVRETIVQSLEEAGYPAVGVPDGAAALRWLRAAPAPPALVFLDLMMPWMNGFQFRAAQLEDPALARIPVFVLSADTKTQDKAAELGVAGALRKPVKLDELLAIAARYTGA